MQNRFMGNTVGSIINHILKIGPGAAKVLNITHAPSFNNIQRYHINNDQYWCDLEVDYTNGPSLSEAIYTIEFDIEEMKENIANVSTQNRTRDIYIEPFSFYVRKGFNYLHALPCYCLSSIDILSPLLLKLGRYIKDIKCKKFFIKNSIFVEVTLKVQSLVIQFYLFTSQYNTQHYLRTTCKNIPPLHQIYVLSKESFDKDHPIANVLSVIDLNLVEEKKGIYKLASIPYELIPFEFEQLKKVSNTVSLTPHVIGDIIMTIQRQNHMTVIFGQCVNDKLEMKEFEHHLSERYLASCFVWREITNAYFTNPDKSKILLIVTFQKGTVLAEYSITCHADDRTVIPEQIKRSYIPKSILLKKKNPIQHFSRVFHNVLFYSPLAATLITSKCILHEGRTMSMKDFGQHFQQANNEKTLINAIEKNFHETFKETRVLYSSEHSSVSFVKLKFTNINIYAFTTKNENSEEISLYDYLYNYLKKINLQLVEKGDLIDDLFCLLNVSN